VEGGPPLASTRAAPCGSRCATRVRADEERTCISGSRAARIAYPRRLSNARQLDSQKFRGLHAAGPAIRGSPTFSGVSSQWQPAILRHLS
jgi:hypothetical protein